MVLMLNEINEQPKVLKKCMEKNKDTVKKLAEEIRARNIQWIYIAARGTSDHAGIYGKYIIESELGIPVAPAAPSVFTLYQKSVNFKNGMVIGISQSGKAADVLEVIKSANSQGALTVSITNFPDSPMAMEANFHLDLSAGLEKSVAATKTFTSQMFVLALLVAELSGNEELKKELSLVPENISHILGTADTIKNKAERYRFANECFVLSRGMNYAIALESALKIQETTYTRAKAFSTSDFQHGPIAMVDNNIPVIVYAPDGPTLNDTESMIDRLTNLGIELIVVSNKQSILDKGTCSISIPYTANDIISPYYNAVVAQLFACSLSLAKGLNPDSPRMLSKVTITK